jgi:hypothetical protein
MQAGKEKLDLLERLLIGDIDVSLFASGFKCASRERQERLLTRLVEHCLLHGAVHRTQSAHLEAMSALLSSLQGPPVRILFYRMALGFPFRACFCELVVHLVLCCLVSSPRVSNSAFFQGK